MRSGLPNRFKLNFESVRRGLEMDTDLIKSILGVAAALIPLIVTIIALLRDRSDKARAVIDNPSLKIVSILRYPVDKTDLIKLRQRSILMFFIFLSLITLIYLA